MKAVLVFIDSTICDTRHRHPLRGTPAFGTPEEIMKDSPVPGGAECIRELAGRYRIVYMGARPEAQRAATEMWLAENGFPPGELLLAPDHEQRLDIAKALKRKYDFATGIGDRWDDNELHLEMGCTSIILREFEGNWDTVRKHLLV
jgi:hypothetical protein